MKKKVFAGLFAVLLSGGLTSAQQKPTAGPVPPEPKTLPTRPGVSQPTLQPLQPGTQVPSGPVRRGLNENLTEEQRTKVNEANAKLRQDTQPWNTKISQARLELHKLTQAEKLDEEAIRAKALEIGKIEGELAVIRAHFQASLKSILPKEEVDRVNGGLANPPGQVPPQFQRRLNTIITNSNPQAKPAQPAPAQTPAPK